MSNRNPKLRGSWHDSCRSRYTWQASTHLASSSLNTLPAHPKQATLYGSLQPLPSSACFRFAFALILAYKFLSTEFPNQQNWFYFLPVYLGIVFTEGHYSLSSFVRFGSRLVLPSLEASNPPRVLGEGQVRCPSLLKKTVASLQLASSSLEFIVSLSAGLSSVHLLQFIQLSLFLRVARYVCTSGFRQPLRAVHQLSMHG